MEQSKVPALVANCGNGDLLIEVRQVRVNGSETDMGGGGSGSGGRSAGYTPTFNASSAASYPGLRGAMFAVAKTSDLPVEVYGIVYLFNPVATKKLGLDKVKAGTALDTTMVKGRNHLPPPGLLRGITQQHQQSRLAHLLLLFQIRPTNNLLRRYLIDHVTFFMLRRRSLCGHDGAGEDT